MLRAGVIVRHDDYFPQVREIRDRNGILLIVDEIQTGLGRPSNEAKDKKYQGRSDHSRRKSGL
jgi:glutamate-1-semialdehyde aminotransferase